ncbi:MAG: Hsp20/alpha crystallin family protein [Candidatus Omnitrophica bacterium]|nr:Hsp20/alpha crystallin family protein [Candidatus Omnitrophota bacterium]
MEGKKKSSFLTVFILILLGLVLVETGIILFAVCGKGTFCFPKHGGPGKQQSPAWSHMLQPEWNPFQEMTLLRERVNRMIDDSFNRGLVNPAMQGMSEQFAFYEPEVDVTENEKSVIVRCDLPGIEKEKVDVEVKDNNVTIKGVRSITQEVKDPALGFFRKERRFGSFTKSFMLPAPVDESHSKANYQNGVLTIELPKLVPGPKDEKSTKVVVV